jgi:hypothetical protein
VAGLPWPWADATGCGGLCHAAVEHLVPPRRPEASKEKPLSPLSGRRIALRTAPPRGCDGPVLVTGTRGQPLALPAREACLAWATRRVALVLRTQPMWSADASGGRVERLPHVYAPALERAHLDGQHARGKQDNHRTPHVKDPQFHAFAKGLRRGVDRLRDGAPRAAPRGGDARYARVIWPTCMAAIITTATGPCGVWRSVTTRSLTHNSLGTCCTPQAFEFIPIKLQMHTGPSKS